MLSPTQKSNFVLTVQIERDIEALQLVYKSTNDESYMPLIKEKKSVLRKLKKENSIA